jgi:hypothetical protein
MIILSRLCNNGGKGILSYLAISHYDPAYARNVTDMIQTEEKLNVFMSKIRTEYKSEIKEDIKNLWEEQVEQ